MWFWPSDVGKKPLNVWVHVWCKIVLKPNNVKKHRLVSICAIRNKLSDTHQSGQSLPSHQVAKGGRVGMQKYNRRSHPSVGWKKGLCDASQLGLCVGRLL